MNIAIRSKDGSLNVLDDAACFVELRTDAGEIACLVYMDALGRLRTITGGDSQHAQSYSRIFKARFAEDITRLED